MSSRAVSKNTQLIVAGLVAATTISLVVVYFVSSKPVSTAKLDDNNGDENTDENVKNEKSTLTSTNQKKSISPDDTPKKSNVTDEKELHSKIEELDKKGKALFKNKQVSFAIFFLNVYTSFGISDIFSSIIMNYRT